MKISIKYLRISFHYWRLTNDEWKLVEERLQARLHSWKRKLLSFWERLVLINLVLSNMVLYDIILPIAKRGLENILLFPVKIMLARG